MDNKINKRTFLSCQIEPRKQNHKNNIVNIKPTHFRNKTDPKINIINFDLIEIPKLNTSYQNIPPKTISQYFEESLSIFNTIHYYLDLSVENNNKPLIKYSKVSKNPQGKNSLRNSKYKYNSMLRYKKLSLKERNNIINEILSQSNKRKEYYLQLFDTINELIDKIKKLCMNNCPYKSNIEEISEIIKLSTIKDEESYHYDFSESRISETSKSIIYNDDDSMLNEVDELAEERKEIHICPKLVVNKNSKNIKTVNLRNSASNTTNNISTNMTSQNENLAARQAQKGSNKCVVF